ncbi:DUF4189 domain-containing protein [Rhizobium leguminosarum]|uniref:DUF4189 domain-containing protein n=1 Tax=Rhizobium leguminosarum TaxID=384 RepID=UPI00047FBE35|nr:DUF4189 domain-containing protein [Rhizobium leguminosarum]
MKRISASLAIVTVLAGAGPALADSCGAIAYSPSTGALGWSYAHDNRGDAVARRNCDSSANDCRIAIWFRNACGAVAVGHCGGWGYDNREAQRQAIRSCRKQTGSCRVIRWQCSENE